MLADANIPANRQVCLPDQRPGSTESLDFRHRLGLVFRPNPRFVIAHPSFDGRKRVARTVFLSYGHIRNGGSRMKLQAAQQALESLHGNGPI